MIRLRLLNLLCALAMIGITMPAAWAQAPSSQPTRLVSPWAAGGLIDAMGRHFAEHLSARMGTPFYVDNKPGAAGTIAATLVAKGPSDGKQLMLTTGAAISIAPHLRPGLKYNPLTDFAFIGMIADLPMSISVRSDSPYQTLADVIKDAKARPGKVSMANTGVGSITHLTAELFGQAVGASFLHVPYQGPTQQFQDLMGGQVDLVMTSSIGLEPFVASRKVRALGTFTRERLASSGMAPTVSKATGIRGLDLPVWLGVMANSQTSPQLLDKLAAEFLAICKLPETQEKFKEVAVCGNAKEFEKVVRDDYKRWGEIIRTADIPPQN
ncbi:tripartite tricarboxylate transporter substrate binding protein [Variovorax rhizosphaerae]|uniref:Tripartite tricarboxylate transporter substrate binding protein n=1 Tax=Variovorax rhizosphaerae TaxID=1836200 RepID=A0ABU8WHI3_9BURK